MKKQEKRKKSAKVAETKPKPKPAADKPKAKANTAAKVIKAEKPAKVDKKASKTEVTESKKRGVFRKLLSPFVRFGRYVAASFRELRLMRFPNRKAAWKMTFAVVIYALIFFIFIALLDTFWGMVFQRLIG
ncbi:preprotein translocase subunit SecE [Candidatus Saccharibacteria bacterium]|nr:preprotein translocase subunit SecE [Candidatus Saccharibacteria bacterium]